jgi:hypothetical protein
MAMKPGSGAAAMLPFRFGQNSWETVRLAVCDSGFSLGRLASRNQHRSPARAGSA